jgi:type III pantothenate kinase
VDRLAAALAAWRESPTGALVVDLGTAITVDWIDAKGVFRGGAIVPGRGLCARVLGECTDQLPDVAATGEDRRPLPGTRTEEAILAGLDAGVPGMVDRLVAELSEVADPGSGRYVTGGDAGWYLARTRREGFVLVPDLVGRGLFLADRDEAEP